MNKHDFFWVVVRGLGLYFLTQAVLAFAAIPQSFGVPVGSGPIMWAALVTAGFHGGLGYYLLVNGALVFRLSRSGEDVPGQRPISGQ